MITSFEVGSVFRITNQATPQLRAILKAVTDLDKAVENTRKNLTGLARTKLTGVSSQFKAITTEVAGLDRALTGTAAAIGRFAKAPAALTVITSAVAGQSAAVQILADEWAKVAASATTAATAIRSASRLRLPPPGGHVPNVPAPPITNPPRPRGGGRHGPRQGWHLGRFGGGIPVTGGHVHASAPSSVPVVAAAAGAYGIYELMKQAEEPMHQEAMLKLLGVDRDDPSMIGRMSAEARSIAIAVPGSGYSKNMQNMGELYSIVGAEGAMAIAPKLAEIDRVQSIVGGKGKEQGSAYVLTRATELMGKLTDPVTHQVDMGLFGGIIDNMSKMSIASHGKVTPEEWLNYAKQAGPAAGNLDIEGLYTTSAIIQAMGGNRAGTAAQALQRQFAGGKMTKPVAEELEHFGLLKSDEWGSDHGHVTLTRSAMAGFVGKLQKDPLRAIVEDFIPALESHGVTSNEDVSRSLYKVIGTGPAQREMYEIIRGREQIRQERERAKAAQAPWAAITTLNQTDPEAVTSAFSTAFKDLLGALGSPLMASSIPTIRGLTTAMNELSAAAGKHKEATTVVASGLAGIVTGGLLGAGGGFLVAGPAGVLPGALYGAGGGGVLGTAYGFMATQQGGHHQTAYDRRQDRLRRNGLLTDESPGLAGWNVVPLPQKIEIAPGKVTLNIDGKAVGEAVVKYAVREGNGATQGSPYPDNTRGGSTFDFSLVN